jgi:ribosome-binding factor A
MERKGGKEGTQAREKEEQTNQLVIIKDQNSYITARQNWKKTPVFRFTADRKLDVRVYSLDLFREVF